LSDQKSIDNYDKLVYNDYVRPAGAKYQTKERNMKMTLNIQVKEINDVYKLVNILIGFEGDVDLESGKYKVDGKSILGIFSLDLRQPIKLTYNNEKGADKLYEQLKPFIVE
jgi:hypothetical protein